MSFECVCAYDVHFYGDKIDWLFKQLLSFDFICFKKLKILKKRKSVSSLEVKAYSKVCHLLNFKS